MSAIRLSFLTACVFVIGTATAAADGYVNVFTGVNFGGDAGRSLDEALDDGSRLTWGAAVGGMTAGIFGAELDVAYTSDFFGEGDPIGSNYVLTVMPSLVLGIPIGGQTGPGIRPYVTAGLGLIKRKLEIGNVEAIDENDLGYALGGGVMIFFATHIGIEGEYRYFRNVDVDESSSVLGISLDRGTFDFSRATAGVVFRF